MNSTTIVTTVAKRGLYGYTPNLAANVVACVLFGLATLYQVLFGLVTKEWWFLVTWGITCVLELTGYIGRAVSHSILGSYAMYKMQLVCLIIAPAFMSAGLYYMLGVETTIYGEYYSPLDPMIYTAIFTTCDVISLIIQGVGGGIASAGLTNGKGPKTGGWIMVGGIAFQVIVLSAFIIMFIWVNYRIFSEKDRSRWDPHYETVRNKPLFKFWLPAVCISLLFLFIRSVYRIVELSEGWEGKLMRTERYFLVLDGLMILFGVIPLTIMHPGLCYGYIRVRGLHYSAKKKPVYPSSDMSHSDQESDKLESFSSKISEES